MVDVVDRETRSRMMANIRGRDTKPEMMVRRMLHAAGYRFRLHHRLMPGRPDIVLPKHRVAIFVHGCFWHRHEGCRLCTTPATRPAFWRDKFSANVERDARNIASLVASGWRVATIWECALKDKGSAEWATALVEWIGTPMGNADQTIVIGAERTASQQSLDSRFALPFR